MRNHRLTAAPRWTWENLVRLAKYRPPEQAVFLLTSVVVGFATGIGAIVFRWLIVTIHGFCVRMAAGGDPRRGAVLLDPRAHGRGTGWSDFSSITSRRRPRGTASRRSWRPSRSAAVVSGPSSPWSSPSPRRSASAVGARWVARGRSCRSDRRWARASGRHSSSPGPECATWWPAVPPPGWRRRSTPRSPAPCSRSRSSSAVSPSPRSAPWSSQRSRPASSAGWPSATSRPSSSRNTQSNSLWEFPLYLLLGVAAAVVATLYTRSIYRMEDLFDRWNIRPWIKPAIGGLLLGLVALAYGFVPGLSYETVPQVYGVGYPTIEGALNGDLLLPAMFVLLILKIFATSLTLGSGGSGGVFAPSPLRRARCWAGASGWRPTPSSRAYPARREPMRWWGWARSSPARPMRR